MWKDLQFASRSLLRQPGFTLVAALTLGLGIGANTAIFTLINAVFLQPLPVRGVSELVSVFTSDPRNPGFLPVSVPNYRDLRDGNSVFSDLIGFANIPVALSTDAEPQQIFGELAAGNYFEAFGVQPALGRAFSGEEDGAPGAHPVVVLSDVFWTRQYGRDPAILGQTIKLNGHPFEVIGVAPPNFNGINAIGRPAFWAPLAMYPQLLPQQQWFDSRRFLLLGVVGRLKPGAGIEQAQAQLQTIAKHLDQQFPTDNKDRGVTLIPLRDSFIDPNNRGNLVSAGTVLMSVTALVLLIACANLANLQLARASGRAKEIAIRLSMGASGSRLIRQLLTESLLLSCLGGLAGLVIGGWGGNLLWSFRPPFLAANDLDLSIDWRVLAFTLGLSLLTGLLFGIAPAIQSIRPDLASELKERTAQAARGGSWFTLRNALAATQVALSMVALAGAGLFLRSMREAQQTDPGFAAPKLAAFDINPGGQGYTPERAQILYRQILERLSAVPGVQSASLANSIPLGNGGFLRSVFIEGQDATPGNRGVLVLANNVTPGYFGTMEIPLLRGRTFTENDLPGSTRVAVINETMAKKFWPDQDAVGKRFRFFGDNSPSEVIGIVKDNKYFAISEAPRSCAFMPVAQQYAPQMGVALRGDDPQALLGAARRAVQELDHNLLITNAFTMKEMIGQSLWAPRMGAALLGVFGLLALLLASIGVYGVMAYTVAQRTSELGIRMALGARPLDVFRLVLAQGFAVTGAGLALGLAGAYALSRYAQGLLVGVKPADPSAYAAAAFLLALVAFAALLLPARRATAIDPVIALRTE